MTQGIEEEEDDDNTLYRKSMYSSPDRFAESFRSAELQQIMGLLEQWEEPESEFNSQVSTPYKGR